MATVTERRFLVMGSHGHLLVVGKGSAADLVADELLAAGADVALGS